MKKKIIISTILFCLNLVCFSQKKTDSVNACWLLGRPLNTQHIEKNAKAIINKSKDDCVLNLINKLVDSSSKKNGVKYLQAISAIAKVSDGYVSEYFDDVGSSIFYKSFDNLFALIYSKNSQFHAPLEKVVIQSIGIKIADAQSPDLEKNRLQSFIKQKSSKWSIDKKNYLKELTKRIYQFAEDRD